MHQLIGVTKFKSFQTRKGKPLGIRFQFRQIYKLWIPAISNYFRCNRTQGRILRCASGLLKLKFESKEHYFRGFFSLTLPLNRNLAVSKHPKAFRL